MTSSHFDSVIRRPLVVTVIGILFIAADAIGFAYHAREFTIPGTAASDVIVVCLVRLVAVGGGG